MKKIRSLFRALALSGVLLVLAVPGAVGAAEVRNGPAAVVAPGETLNDDLFATGQTVTVAGQVTGDVFAAGQTVVVTGTVAGDLIAAAQQVVVDGTVNGDVRAAGAVVTINGQVGRSVTSLAQQVNVSSSARLGGSLVAAGGTISAFGPVGRGITAGAGTLQLGGPVGGDVLAWAETLSLGPNTRIAGDLEYRSEREVAVSGGVVGGRVQFTPIEREERQEPLLNGLLSFGSLVWLVGTAILGAVAVTLAPRAAARVVEAGRQQPLQSFGLGLLALFAVPLAALLVAVTMVGLPLAVVVGGLWAVGLMLAKPALGLLVGTELARWARRGQLPVLGALVVGLIVLHLLRHVPVAGELVSFLGLALGLGLVVQSVRRWRRPTEPVGGPLPDAVAA
jgi:cytoskeletal protein CcmA (bactofilin family)